MSVPATRTGLSCWVSVLHRVIAMGAADVWHKAALIPMQAPLWIGCVLLVVCQEQPGLEEMHWLHTPTYIVTEIA